MRKKLITVAIIALFLGLAVSPSIHADVDDSELVEVTTEFCGIDRSPHKVKLTREQADELEELFDDIKNQLDTVETREEAEDIFKEALVELDKYGLLGGLSVKQAQRLVTGGYQNTRVMHIWEKLFGRIQADIDFNFFCLVAGRTNYTYCVHRLNPWFFLCFVDLDIIMFWY